MVDKECQASNWDDQEFHPESVVVAIVGGLEFNVDQVNCGIGTCDVEDLCGGHAKNIVLHIVYKTFSAE